MAHDSYEDTDWRYIKSMPLSGTSGSIKTFLPHVLGALLTIYSIANLFVLTNHTQRTKNKALQLLQLWPGAFPTPPYVLIIPQVYADPVGQLPGYDWYYG